MIINCKQKIRNQRHIGWDIVGRVFQDRYIHRTQNPRASHEPGRMRDLKYHDFKICLKILHYHVVLQLMMIIIVHGTF